MDITGLREGDIADFYVKYGNKSDILKKIDKYSKLIKEEVEIIFLKIPFLK